MTANSNILQASPIEPVITQPTINRREFLTYAWGATLALLAVEGTVTSYVFLAPRFRAGEFGGKFSLGSAGSLPTIDAAPQPNAAGKFWLVNTDEGTRAIYMVCTHLGCLYKWNDEADRFQCPCHGSEFTREGDYIKGPAPRSLDQFIVEVLDEGETIAATAETEAGANPPTIASKTAQLIVNTGKRINGQPKNLSPAIEHI
jgi:cytochrome b6-f complex iron-sulfur subunit